MIKKPHLNPSDTMGSFGRVLGVKFGKWMRIVDYGQDKSFESVLGKGFGAYVLTHSNLPLYNVIAINEGKGKRDEGEFQWSGSQCAGAQQD